MDHNLFRFDFVNKKEFNLQTGEHNKLQYFEKHALLIDYSENLITTFINSKPDNPEIFIKDIENAINEVTLGWRSWKNYITENNFFTFETFKKNIADGSGKLSYAPFSITQNILNVCNKHNVSITAFDNQLKRENFKLIIIGKSYLIAKDFKFHEQ
ncbi:hypothetical protein [Flavobacterium noncentrifugens]|nr:hypothetical protein [Flavobacterium noncentrifugens]